jgi:hypothetical protein
VRVSALLGEENILETSEINKDKYRQKAKYKLSKL